MCAGASGRVVGLSSHPNAALVSSGAWCRRSSMPAEKLLDGLCGGICVCA